MSKRITKINADVLKAFEDPRNFFKFLRVFNKETGTVEPFVLRPQQEELLEALLTHNRIVVLKARQLGISTLLRAYFLWKTYMSSEPTRHAIISYTRDSADHLHNMDKTFYESLPNILKRKLSKSSSRTLQFGDTNAELRAFTAGGKAGATRSFTFSDTHISEFAFFDDQDDLLANVIASVGDGQIVIETTPNSPGDKYHELIEGAPENGWHLCWFPWYEHKEYTKKSQFHQPQVPDPTEEELEIKAQFGLTLSQLYWRRTMVSTMGIEKFRREFPATVDEAFFSAANEFFPIDVLDGMEVVDLGGQKERWYCEPLEGDRYAMGVDVAGGRGGDYSTITVVSCTTMLPIYHFRCNQILPHVFADKIYEMYWEFGEPYTIIEQNGPGETVLYRMKEWKVKNLYKDAKGKDWRTRKENKIAIFDYLRDLICEGVIVSVDKTLWSELRNIQLTKGAPAALGGANDDLVMATALAVWAAKLKPVPNIMQVRKTMIDAMIKSTRAKKIIREGGYHKMIAGGRR